MTDAAPGTVEREVRIEAAPAEVFPYFTDPVRMSRWMGIDCKLDATAGGSFRVDMNGSDVAGGHYVVVEPPGRIVLTWGWEGSAEMPPGSTTVEVLLIADGDGTVVRLTHREIPPSQVESHTAGWDHYLARLEAAAAGRDPDAARP